MMGQSKWDEKMYSKYGHAFLRLVYVSFKINIDRCSTFDKNTINEVTKNLEFDVFIIFFAIITNVALPVLQ